MKHTCDAGHWTGLLQVTKEHFLFVEHLCRFMFSLFRVDEDGPEKVGGPVSHPHFLYPVTVTDPEVDRLIVLQYHCVS